MPRTQVPAIQAQGAAAVEFFRKAPLELAEFVFGLCRQALKERKDKSAAAKEVAASHGITKPKNTPKQAARTGAGARKVAKKKAKAAGPKKSHKKKPAAAAASAGAAVSQFPTPGSPQDTVGPTVPAEPEMAGSAV